MRYLWTPLAALIFSIAACTKEPSTPATPPTVDPTDTTDSTAVDTTYIVNGLTDLTIGAYRDSAQLILAVNYISGTQEKVTFTISGLPKGVTAYFVPAASGIPSFSTTLKFNSTYSKEGTYPITLTGKSVSGIEKSYEINLTVSASTVPPCGSLISLNSSSFTTTLRGSTTVVSSGAFFLFDRYIQNMYLETINGQPVLSNDYMGRFEGEVGFTADCDAQTITLPAKVISVSTPAGLKNYTVYGSGIIDFDAKKLVIDYSVVTGASTFDYTMRADLYL